MKTGQIALWQLEQWVQNDEGLYLDWRYSRQSLRAYVKANREELTQAYKRMINAAPAEPLRRAYA